jgi:hypothetical protein
VREAFFVFAAKQNRAVLEIGVAHARAQLDEVFVGVDDAAFDHLSRARVVSALVECHPTATK